MPSEAEIGVIGGSGLYDMDGLTDIEEVRVETPFGDPSDALIIGTVESRRVAFLPRHGRGHRLLPSEVPYRANIFALKKIGVRRVISASAVGSLREDLPPLHMVVPDQLFDRTKQRASTFFGNGIVAHIAFAHPFCDDMRETLLGASTSVVAESHRDGTYVCMEGPAFSTYAESTAYRQLGFDIIGMTALPEAKLAREAQMCYAILAQVTDFDCWHPEHDAVTGDMVMANVARNVVNAREILRRAIPALEDSPDCPCRHALAGAIATSADAIPQDVRARLAPLFE